MYIDLKEFTVEELTDLIRRAKAERLRKLYIGPLKQKRINLAKNARIRIYRQINRNFPVEIRDKIKSKIVRGFGLPTDKRTAAAIKIGELRKIIKRIEKLEKSFERQFNKNKEKIIKKLSKYLPEKESKEVVKKIKNKTKILYQKNYLDVLSSEGEEDFGDYKRIVTLYQENIYPDKKNFFEEILQKKGFEFQEDGTLKLNKEKIFKETINEVLAGEPELAELPFETFEL